MNMDRRSFAIAGVAGLLALRAGPLRAGTADEFAAIEARTGGRLGVAVIDTASGARYGHRADERFPLCSSFKALAAAAVLAKVDAGTESLDRRVHFSKAELVPYSPFAEKHVADGITLAQACAATVTLSDNTAGNIVLAAAGGPAAFTGWLRALGDPVTRLDRTEPTLNEAKPGDVRDTTSPAAMAGLLRTLVLGEALSPASRDRLRGWLIANTTGDARLRAGVPAGWKVGDKTGTCNRATPNDSGLLWPPGGKAPLIVSVYIAEAKAAPDVLNAAIADVARLAVAKAG